MQNPLGSLADDVAHTVRILDLKDEPTILVGHSFAGTVITQAGVDPRVVGLVYVAARAPDAGEDYAALAKRFPEPPANLAGLQGWLRRPYRRYLSRRLRERCRARSSAHALAVQGRVSETLFHDRVSEDAWRTKPSWHVISSNDRTTSPELAVVWRTMELAPADCRDTTPTFR
ncbi:MAG: alpha/beta fold hydrolase [Solirubrobacteraceae bacterium]